MQDLWVLPTDLALPGHILHFLREDVPMSHFTYLPSRENRSDCLSLSIVIKPHACTIPFSQTSECTVMSLLYFSLNGSKWLHCRRGFCLLIVIEQNRIKYQNTNSSSRSTPTLSALPGMQTMNLPVFHNPTIQKPCSRPAWFGIHHSSPWIKHLFTSSKPKRY